MNSFAPDDEGHFGFWCQALVGPVGEEGGDLFHFCVCTPSWFASEMDAGKVSDPAFGRGLILVSRYDYDRVIELVARYAARCSGDDWEEVASKIGRMGRWEFEDYQPYRGTA
jgi:hypothetical protein